MHTDYLNAVEQALETILRRHLSGKLPASAREDIASRLVAAMRRHIRREVDGSWIAPNVYFLFLPPATATLFRDRPDMLEALGNALWMGGRQQRLRFPGKPVIHPVTDPSLMSGQLRIEAHIRLDAAPEASVMGQVLDISPETIPQSAFLIVQSKQVFTIDRPVVNIGRRLDNHLVLEDPRVSRAHAQIRLQQGRFVLYDLNSTGGTFVNGQRIDGPRVLHPGDVISLAGVTLVFGQDTPPDREEYTRPFPPQPAGDEKTRVSPRRKQP